MKSRFLGVGWNFPLMLEKNNSRIAKAAYEESVRQAIWIILATAPGERVMRPDFGCGIHDLVFEVSSAGTATRLASHVRQALVRWEPRIDVMNVQVTSGEDRAVLFIGIEYKVRATNNSFNLVYPFYLEGSPS
jgi:uncharacterized protein